MEDYLQLMLDAEPENILRGLTRDLKSEVKTVVSEATLIDIALDEDDISFDDLRDMVKMILKAADKASLMLDAAAEYDRIQRGKADGTP